MKQPFGSSLPPTPTAGDVCYLDDGTVHFCYSAGSWTQISGGSSGGGTFQYGTFGFVIANETTVTARGSWPEWVSYKAADVYHNSAPYFRSTWDILEVDDGGTIYNTWTEQKFADITALYAFVDSNFTSAGGGTVTNHAVARVYDVIDPGVPKIDKIWGLNTFYSILKGKNNYRSNPCAMAGAPNWGFFSNWFTDLCNQGIGFGAGHVYASNDERALWFSRNDQKRYGMPAPGYICEIGVNGGRWIWNSGTLTFTAIPAVQSYTNAVSSGLQRLYCSLNLTGHNSWEWFDPADTTPFMQALAGESRSWITLYALEDASDNTRRSIQIKPLGLDRLGLTWFDSTTYDLFALYTKKSATPIQRHITNLGMSSAVKDLQWVEYADWIPPEWGATRARYSLNMVGKQPYTTQFFLRDKTTDVVSPVSQARVIRAQRHRDAPLKYEVRR